jgi:HK97 family phage portal protein
MVTVPGLSLATQLAVRAAQIGVNILTATDGRDILLNQPDGWEIDQPQLWWLGPSGGDGTGGPIGNPPPGAGGPYWGMAALPAVTRCTSIIADTIAGLPWVVIRGAYDLQSTPTWIADPQVLRLDGRTLGSVDPLDVRLSAVEFWTNWITSALWLGDGFIYCPVLDKAGQPKPPMWTLHPDLVSIENGGYDVNGVTIPPENILHLRGEPPYSVDGKGTGVLTRHGPDLGLAITVTSYAQSMYRSGVPAGFLKSTQPNLKQAQADALKTSWMAAHGSGARSIAVLNATTDFTPIQISPVDSALDLAKTWSLRDIAMMFGVPAYMLGVPVSSDTYANVESRMIELRQFTHLNWIRRIESTLDARFPAGTSLKIKSAGLERADTKTRYEAYKLGIDGGWLTVDDVRLLEDMAPLEADLSNVLQLQPSATTDLSQGGGTV